MRKRINEHLNSIDEYLKQIGLCYESVNLAPFTFDKKLLLTLNIKISLDVKLFLCID